VYTAVWAVYTAPVHVHGRHRYYYFYITNNNKCSAVAEIGDRLATVDMGRKEGAVVPVWGVPI